MAAFLVGALSLLWLGSPSYSADSLQVLQTNANNGYLYPCKCPSEPKGGLAKRATLIKQLTDNSRQLTGNKQQYLLFDSGDILGLDSDRRTDSLVFASYRAMGYQAIAVGDQELSRGVEQFRILRKKTGLTFLSANLFYQGQQLVEGHRIITLSNPRASVAVIGLLSPNAFKYYPKEITDGIEVRDPATTLRQLVDELRPKADILVLLSHLGFEQEQEIARAFPELDLIIGGHTQNELKTADASAGVPIVEAGPKAVYLTEAWLSKAGARWRLARSRLAGITSDLADDPAVVSIVGAYVPKGHASVKVQGSGDIAVDVFFAPECPDCEQLKQGLLTELATTYNGRVRIVYHSVDDPLEYQKLLDAETRLNDRNNQIPAVVIGSRILGGVEEIRQGLKAEVLKAIKRGKPAPGKPSKTLLTAPDTSSARGQVRPDSIRLAFVTNARCAKCGRAEYMLRAFQAGQPRLVVRRLDIGNEQDRLLAEAMGILYDVPAEKRLTPPLAYVGTDWLAGDRVDDARLGALLSKYSNGTAAVPWLDAEAFLPQARQGLLHRFRSFGALGVALAGLLDGINPCSLAVLVFFISYLAFVGRKRWEILAVGVAYTLADFIVYFLIGVGGLSFLMSLKALPTISRLLYWLAVAAGLALAAYNFRDYLKARRGDYAGMALQLSTGAKQRIHRVIREKMGAKSLIGGAFLVGLATSVLEFACTGQVYLPTIAFVSQIAGERLRAYGLLLLYNLMFEVPMVATFVIAFWGVSSKRIADWAEASVAVVKLATAALFLLMSAGLVYVLLT